MDTLREDLRKWFKKSSEGGEDWVRISTTGEIMGSCGKKKKQKNPARCLPRSKANSLSKKQRAATARKKKRGGKKGKQFVSNTKKAKVKMKKEDLMNIIREELSQIVIEKKKKKSKDACYKKVVARYGPKTSAYRSGAMAKCRKMGAANWGKSKKNEEIELKNPKKADLDKDGKLSSYEKTRGAAIEKNLKEMCGPIMEYLNEIKAEDETEFTVSLKHLLKKHVTKGGEMK